MDKSRDQAITRTSIIGILTNIFLAAFKAVAGMMAGSIAIVLDAVNNLTDAMSSVITIAGIKLAKMKPNEKHPYGHGRVEYFSTILIAFIILAAGGSSAIESIKKIIEPSVANYSIVTIIIIVTSVLAKLILGKFVKSQGEKYNSDALIASGSDASFDAIISASTLLGALATLLLHISIEGIIGAVISLFIIKAGIEMLSEAISHVIGHRADSEITKSIKKTVNEIPQVLGAYDLVLHNYGPETAMGSIQVEIPADMSAAEIHKLAHTIQRTVREKYQISISVGIYAIDFKDDVKMAMRSRIDEICKQYEGVVNTHGVFIEHEEKTISFDIMTDFTLKDRKKFIEMIREAVEKEYPGYRVLINLDTNYSD